MAFSFNKHLFSKDKNNLSYCLLRIRLCTHVDENMFYETNLDSHELFHKIHLCYNPIFKKLQRNKNRYSNEYILKLINIIQFNEKSFITRIPQINNFIRYLVLH